MAVDNRPFKSKEQDGQGNEVIIRDQQLVEQGTATTMASGACFETRDVDDRPVKIPRDNMMNIVLECIGIILNDSSRNLGTDVQKALGLQGNTVGHSTVADFASVLGGRKALVKHIGLTQTTSESGNASYVFGSDTFVLCASVANLSDKIAIPYHTNTQDFLPNGSRQWYFRVLNNDGSVLANTEVMFDVLYLNL